jgi:hypothetical protein
MCLMSEQKFPHLVVVKKKILAILKGIFYIQDKVT